MTEAERTAPTVYGKLQVVCENCLTSFGVRVNVGPKGRDMSVVTCEHCGTHHYFAISFAEEGSVA